MIAVDASAMIELLQRGSSAPRIEALLDDDIVAPDLLVPEVLHTLQRFERSGRDVEPALAVLLEAAIEFAPVWPHIERVWELRHTVSPCDACYLAVAEAYGCPLLTSDERLGRVTDTGVPVIVA